MNKDSKVYLAGHNGLVGSAIHKQLLDKGFTNIIYRDFSELDLRNQQATEDFFEQEKPEIVILAAAKVGGIMANNTYRADFIYENLMIQNNIIHQSYKHEVKKLLFLGSSCIYPKDAPQPIKEEYLLNSDLEYTNEPYAIAKIAGIKLCESYNLQYNTNFISVMPTNLYGPGDNYDLNKSHVLPALIRKFHLAKSYSENDFNSIKQDLIKNKISGIETSSLTDESVIEILKNFGISKNDTGDIGIKLWGSGKPFREFLHANDMANACIYLLEKVDFYNLKQHNAPIKNTHINIGTGIDLSIKDLAYLVKEIVGFSGDIEWDTSKPDGTYRKLLDVSKLSNLGWKYSIELKNGIQQTYQEYLER